MSLNYRQRHRLLLVKAGMRRSDLLLCAMFGMFGRLYKGEGMPAWEQVPTSPDRGRIAAPGPTRARLGGPLSPGADLTGLWPGAVRDGRQPGLRITRHRGQADLGSLPAPR